MIIKKELDFAKEADDVLALVVELIKTIKDKGDYLPLVDELVAAISGANEIPAELKNFPAIGATVGSRVGEIVSLFVPVENK